MKAARWIRQHVVSPSWKQNSNESHELRNTIISIRDALVRLKREFPDAGPWQLIGALFAALEERNIDIDIHQITCTDASGRASASDYFIQVQSTPCEFDTANMIENLSPHREKFHAGYCPGKYLIQSLMY